jgi:uncharacterized protein YigA (DUF484 family)
MRVEGIDQRLEVLESALRESFGAERAVLVWFSDDPKAGPSRPGFLKKFERDDPELAPFSTFLRSARARCGSLRDRQKEILFDREADTITSAAMVPIGENARLGFLTVGSKDPNQFHPSQRVDFLGRLGELVATALDDGNERERARG